MQHTHNYTYYTHVNIKAANNITVFPLIFIYMQLGLQMLVHIIIIVYVDANNIAS